MDPEPLTVRVVYALPEEQWDTSVSLAPGATAIQAVEQSGLLDRCPGIRAHPLTLAVYGRVIQPGTLLKAGDRVEIVRPLLRDPKEARRQRASDSRAGRAPR